MFFNQYDALLKSLNIDKRSFVHQLFPPIIRHILPGVNFAMIGDIQIEWPEEVELPTPEVIALELQKLTEATSKYKDVFELCFENGKLVKTAYKADSNSSEVNSLFYELPRLFKVDNALSISEGNSNTVYDNDYISIYYKGKYLNTNSESYAYKVSKATKAILDVKLITTITPDIYKSFIPENAVKTLFGSFTKDNTFVEVGFAFKTEEEFATFLGSDYVPPIAYSGLGIGMVGLTIDTTTNSVVRTKRYFFG